MARSAVQFPLPTLAAAIYPLPTRQGRCVKPLAKRGRAWTTPDNSPQILGTRKNRRRNQRDVLMVRHGIECSPSYSLKFLLCQVSVLFSMTDRWNISWRAFCHRNGRRKHRTGRNALCHLYVVIVYRFGLSAHFGSKG